MYLTPCWRVTSCVVGDLYGKLGKVGVGATRGSARHTTVDLNLPLTGNTNITGHTLMLLSGTQPLACATIRLYHTRSALAEFDNDGVTGSVTLTQPSPLDPVTSVVKLNNLRSEAGGYHIHEYPVPQRVTADQNLCSGASVGGHFNPFNIVYGAGSPAAATSTEDVYEVRRLLDM